MPNAGMMPVHMSLVRTPPLAPVMMGSSPGSHCNCPATRHTQPNILSSTASVDVFSGSKLGTPSSCDASASARSRSLSDSADVFKLTPTSRTLAPPLRHQLHEAANFRVQTLVRPALIVLRL